MNPRKLLAGAAVVTSLLVSGAVSASADILSNLANSFGGGTYNIKLQDYENFSSTTLAPGTQNYGLFELTSILTPGGVTAWSSGQGGYLVGVYDGVTVQTVGAQVTGDFTENTGGTFNLYQLSSLPNFAQNTAGYTTGGCSTIGGLCYNGITNVGGKLVLSYNLAPGASALDPSSTLQASIDGTTVPVTGEASGFANITGGADEPLFVTGAFGTAIGTTADIEVQDDFCGPNSTGCPTDGWQELSQDPVKAALKAIPEPGSLALLGGTLVSLGMVGYRRRRKHRGA